MSAKTIRPTTKIAVVALPLAAPIFGIPATAFWIYVCAALLLVIGLVRISAELREPHGVDRIMPFGPLFFAIPMAVFGTEHFTDTADIAALVPRWIPAHLFWAYAVGAGFLCAGLAIAARVQARLAAALVGVVMLIFVLVMDIPGLLAHTDNRFFWALALRQLAFSGGGFALAMSPWSARPPRPSLRERRAAWVAVPRLFVAIPCVFYGVEHFLHPAHVPGIPLKQLSPEWIPGRIVLSYFVGVVLVLAGAALIVNKRSREAATVLGLTILLAVLWIYLPMLLAAPTSLVALNYFFDTLLFCGVILALA
jgi:uncharacterized membrane protein